MWEKSWRHFGWDPHVLGEADALASNPKACAKIMASAELRRGPLPEGYALATHLRWAAHPGGLIVDYDVLNNGFTADTLMEAIGNSAVSDAVFLNACPCCCAVFARRVATMRMLNSILEHDAEHGKPASYPGELSFVCHDQAIFERFKDRWHYPQKSYVTEYTRPGWRDAPLIHFANCVTKTPRSQIIAKLNLPQC